MKDVGTGIIVRDGKIFIGQRPEGKPLAGLWEFPGGKQEEGESIEECLKRELREELNIEATVGKHIMDTTYRYPENEFCLHVYMVTIPENAKIKLNVHQNSAWVKASDMNKYKFPPADEEIIKKLQDIAV
ncbi:MAG: 8-oxo-dGTP diphosphatase MutT [Alphaproteobacteria bacterium]|nr:8-oxo-dGTP diphosphatase MutT [Alphaproteobacteria bacterium]